MITKDYVKQLAELARLEISDDEQEELVQDLEAILEYVSEIGAVVTDDIHPEVGTVYNVMRDDVPREDDCDVEAVLCEVPEKEKGFVKVEKIL